MGRRLIVLIVSVFFLSFTFTTVKRWGFFGHRLINRTAIYTLPLDLYRFYKNHIDYIEYHSVDPDKRRYAVEAEGKRHYIDLDYWADSDRILDKTLRDLIFEHAQITASRSDQRPVFINVEDVDSIKTQRIESIYQRYKESWSEILNEDHISFYIDDIKGDSVKVKITDRFTDHGILPFHIYYYYGLLERSFLNQNLEEILRYSAEIGHYISDAHVPLHTTMNYDGQLSGQKGIHAFWESRIPELFAIQEYDLYVDKAQYILDVKSFVRDIVINTHQLVDDVLEIEQELSQSWPEDQKYCYDERGVNIVRMPCKEYAREYQNRMKHMVERQMRKSISAIGSIWYTAWENGGRPDMRKLYANYEINRSDESLDRHILRKN